MNYIIKNRFYFLLLAILLLSINTVNAQTTLTVGGIDADYSTLESAFYDINNGTYTGNIVLQINENLNESNPAVLYESGYTGSGLGTSSYTSVLIYPTTSGLSISCDFYGPLIDLNGADNVTIDGSVNATGSAKDLTITNYSTYNYNGTSTIRFINDASSNTLKYCTIRGAETDLESGVIFFSTANTIGNNNNVINNNDITNSDGNRPLNAIYSKGTAGYENSGNQITENNIYDFLNLYSRSYGIRMDNYSTYWVISNNSLYETQNLSLYNTEKPALISVFSGDGTYINQNYLGGSEPLCTGRMTIDCYYGIDFNCIEIESGGTITKFDISNNLIKNITFKYSGTYSGNWTGINCNATADIGTLGGNIIGSSSENDAILLQNFTSNATPIGWGIILNGIESEHKLQNNTIGGITTQCLSNNNSYGFYGVSLLKSNNSTISNNLIGSETISNSIHTTSLSDNFTQSLVGMGLASNNTVILTNNIVSNLTNLSTSNAFTIGVLSDVDIHASGNTISYLTGAGNRTDVTIPSVCGFSVSGSKDIQISRSHIHHLTNTQNGFTGWVIGIVTLPENNSWTVFENDVHTNFIHDLNVSGTSSAAHIAGIYLNSGTMNSFNNILLLGDSHASKIYGIYDAGVSSQNSKVYFNTVYLGGTVASGNTDKSYGLFSAGNSGNRDYRNNLLVNARSTTNGSNLHFAIGHALNSATGLTENYNNYYSTGTAGSIAELAGNPIGTVADLVSNLGTDSNSKSFDPLFSGAGGTNATDYYPLSNNLSGLNISDITVDYQGSSRLNTPTIGALELDVPGVVEIWKNNVLQNDFATLKDAFFKINDGTYTGALEVRVKGNTNEISTATLYESGHNGVSNYSSIHIFPTVTGLTIGGSLDAPLIDLNGADNVTFDGRVNGVGIAKDLTIINTSVSSLNGTSTIRFINDASANTIKYCNIKGSETDVLSGIIFFSSTTGSTGSDNNTLDNNNITNASDANRPVNAVFSLGTVSKENSGNTFINNNIYDFLNRGIISNGIHLSSYSDDCSILSNSFYETTNFIPTASVEYRVINIDSKGVHKSSLFEINENFIGGSTVLCGGTSWTKTNDFNNTFTAIYLNASATTLNTDQINIQGNIIRNFNYNNISTGWTGIYAAGAFYIANVGTETGNIIGSSTGTGSITFTATTSGATFYGINLADPGTVNCYNNTIGSITVSNAGTNATNFIGISRGNVGGSFPANIFNNLIGSNSTPNSIYASSASTGNSQEMKGIEYHDFNSATINNNTIANMTNGTTNTNTSSIGLIHGIYCKQGSNTVNNNTIFNLTISNANTSNNRYASVTGILIDNSGAIGLRTVSGNKIYNLSNKYNSFAGNVTGLFFSGSTSYANEVSKNFIHSLSVASTTESAQIFGLNIYSGNTTYSNNIISISGATKTTIYGIYDNGFSSNNTNLYFNTISVNGSLETSGTNSSFCLYSNASGNIRNFRNNIFSNTRSNNGGSGKHYAAYFNYATTGSMALNYNNYYAPNTGGVLGFYNSTDVNTLPLITGQDANSYNYNPLFTVPNGTTAIDYYPGANNLFGTTISGITTDYAGVYRYSTPTIGAFERPFDVVEVYKASVLQAYYTTLKQAFDKINDGTHTGELEVRITNNTIENFSAVLYQSGYNGTSDYSKITIFPTATGKSVSGNLDSPLIDFNGADNVILDGRVNASGSAKDLTVINSNYLSTAGTSTIRFINDASNNVVKYCNIKGSENYSQGGIVFFSTTTGTTGNNNNTIDNNNITNANDYYRPQNAIYSAGTTGKANSGITISNNNVYDFLSRIISSSGISFGANTTTSTVSGNSFYETTNFTVSTIANHNIISIGNNGTGFNVSGNFIGGRSTQCGGSSWSRSSNNSSYNYTNIISLNVGVGTASNIQGNTIKNLNWSDTSPRFTVIDVSGGDVNIGTTVGNTIGASTGTGSIYVTGSGGAYFNGISLAGNGILNCQNNIISSISTNNSSTNGNSITAIYINRNVATIISNNTIGSSTANSIYAVSAGTNTGQTVMGIQNLGNGTLTINNNTIENLTNGTTASVGSVSGIYSSSGANTITNNIIRNLTIANNNTSSYHDASVTGIAVSGNYLKTISGNTIYNLSNTRASFGGYVTGLYVAGNTESNTISKNFIHSLSSTGTSASSIVSGIRAHNGSITFSNNIIRIGDNSANIFYGIYDNGAASQTCNLYHNTIYLAGSPTTGSAESYSLYSNANTNTRNFRNNLFNNARSNNGSATGKHYAAYFNYSTPGALTLDYNNYFVNGTDGMLAYYNSANYTTFSALKTAIGQNVHSNSINPLFALAGGTSALNYLPSYSRLKGVGGTGITTDYANVTRFTTQPAMGALEYGAESFSKVLSVKVYLQGMWNSSNNNMNTCKIVGGITPKFSGTVVDTVFLELHDPANYSIIVHKVYGLELQQDGSINSPGLGYIDIPETYSGNYYVTVRTRNHLQTTSAAGVSFAPDSPVYDFTTAASQAYGGNMKQLATGTYGFYAGDVTQDGLIDPLTDFALVKSAINSYAAGYHVCDLNGDGLIDPLTDFATVKAQINAYIKAILP